MKKVLLFAMAMLAGTASSFAADDAITTATYGNATGNTTRTMTIALTHTTDYVAFQADLTLPANTTVKAVTAKAALKNGETVDLSAKGGSAAESTDFNVPFKQSSTNCRILGYNLGNKAIAGTSGDILLTVTLETTDAIAYNASTVTAKNVVFVKASDLSEVTLAEATSDSRLWGDVNIDKKVNTTDVQQTANLSVGKAITGTVDKFAADVNQDDKINSTDIQKVANISVGK